MSVRDYLEFVKDRAGYHERQVTKFERKADERSARLHRDFASKFRDLAEAIASEPEHAQDIAPSVAPVEDEFLAQLLASPLHLTAASAFGLPPELEKELNITDTDRFEWSVVELVNKAPNRQLSLEVLLVALWHRTQQVHSRASLANKLYRMGRKGMLFGVPGKKGVYTTIRPEDYSEATSNDFDKEAADTGTEQ